MEKEVNLNHNDFERGFDENLGVSIETFLGLQNSSNTEKSYKRWIDEFFEFAFDNTYHFVTIEELELLNNMVVDRFRLYLLNTKGNVANSVNSKVGALIKMFKYLEKNGYNINTEKLRPLDSLKHVQNSYEPFSEAEVRLMIEKAKGYRNGIQKSLMIELAYRTGIRKNAILGLTPANFKLQPSGWEISVVEKGDKVSKTPVMYDFYERLSVLINECDDDQKIFNIGDRNANYVVSKLIEDLQITGNKNFHSLKKNHVHQIHDVSDGDISLMQLAANHSSAEVTRKYYYEDATIQDKYRAAISMFDGIDLKSIEGATRKELINAIKECGITVHIGIISKLNKNKKEKGE